MDTSKLKYAETHEWLELSGKIARVGISDHAQKEISDIVFIELPKLGRVAKQKESVMVIESVKAAFDIYAPVSGKIIKVNEDLSKNPEIVNRSPYEKGWLFEMECTDPKEADLLLSEAQYQGIQDTAHH